MLLTAARVIAETSLSAITRKAGLSSPSTFLKTSCRCSPAESASFGYALLSVSCCAVFAACWCFAGSSGSSTLLAPE